MTQRDRSILPRLVGAVMKRVARFLPTTEVENLIISVLAERTQKLPPDEALRFLFRLDKTLYQQQGQQAVRYGDGLHTKHRHIGYHQFFIDRIQPEDRVLDIGCGLGALAYSIATQTEASLVGVDHSQQNIDLANESFDHERITYIHGDIFDEIPDGQYSVVVMSNVLEHLTDRVNLLRRVARSTTADRFLIRVPRFDRHWSVPLKKELGVDWRLDEDHETEYTPESFAEEMIDAGLRIHHIEYRWDEIWAELAVADTDD